MARRFFAVLLTVLVGTAAHADSPWEGFTTPQAGAAEAVGGYANGCLIGGRQLPTEGSGFQFVRLAYGRNYGHPKMDAYLKDLGERVAEAGIGTMLVADVAMPRGGRFATGHRSHQTGLDADIWLRLDTPPLPPHIKLEQAKSFASSLLKGDTDARGIITQSIKEQLESFLPSDKSR